MILAGDIGGTNSRLALFENDGRRLVKNTLEVYPSKKYKSLAGIISRFIYRHRIEIESACFGIAGPVKDGVAQTPNLPWRVADSEIAEQLQLKRVRLVNDLHANAAGIGSLGEHDFTVINKGRKARSGNMALISAGTGLGEAGIVQDSGRFTTIPSEGGHVDFSPRNALEAEMLAFALWRSSHVSFEYFLSGPGLVRIFEFLVVSGREKEPDWLFQGPIHDDRAATIAKFAADNRCPACIKAMDIFVSLYASEAGNLALKFLATGGVFLGGGIAPKIVSKFKNARFMNSFAAKGRMESLLRAIPVKVIMNDKTALLGAARIAATSILPTTFTPIQSQPALVS